MKVLAIFENPALEAEFGANGCELIPARSVEEFEAVRDLEPDFVLVDEKQAEAADVLVRIKAEIDGPDRDRLPILAIGTRGNGRSLRCLPDVAFSQGTVADIVKAGKQLILKRARQRRLFDQEAILKVPTTPENVERVGEMLEQLIAPAGYSEEDQVKLAHTLREAIGNAAEHGNKRDPERTIHVDFLRSADRLTVVVTDEGSGFDTSSFLSRADQVSALEHTRSRRATEARPGGLGVFIMRQTCDEITFNDAGNSILLMKYLPNHVRA